MNIIAMAALAASLAVLLAACSSDSGTSVPLEEPIGDINGGWSILETFNSSTSECNGQQAYDATITQDGNPVVVAGEGDDRVTGTLSGDALSLTGSRADGDGIITYASIQGKVSADCSSFNADSTWVYKERGSLVVAFVDTTLWRPLFAGTF